MFLKQYSLWYRDNFWITRRTQNSLKWKLFKIVQCFLRLEMSLFLITWCTYDFGVSLCAIVSKSKGHPLSFIVPKSIGHPLLQNLGLITIFHYLYLNKTSDQHWKIISKEDMIQFCSYNLVLFWSSLLQF